MLFGSIKEISKLISKEISNIYLKRLLQKKTTVLKTSIF